MRVSLREDEILAIVNDGIEVGNFPDGVGFERLRFDGTSVVDLNDLSSIWVREISPGFFKLHSQEVHASQLVQMSYVNRRNLINDGGVIRVMTQSEINSARQAKDAELSECESLKAEAKSIIDDLSYSKIDNHVDGLFDNFSAAQRTSLKRLYKAVLFLVKRSR